MWARESSWIKEDFSLMASARVSLMATVPRGVSQEPRAMIETGAPRPVWFGPMST